jgi:hypothetical protein
VPHLAGLFQTNERLRAPVERPRVFVIQQVVREKDVFITSSIVNNSYGVLNCAPFSSSEKTSTAVGANRTDHDSLRIKPEKW